MKIEFDDSNVTATILASNNLDEAKVKEIVAILDGLSIDDVNYHLQMVYKHIKQSSRNLQLTP